ncbi:MAG TPA: amidohydrolase family protein [Steroidobacteraceae bacterium]|jgi:predicted TIM-barrel fold metal-dependent hydrolase|nr:amidohydrolase family protein [Steroidobacteraceae bacterium]
MNESESSLPPIVDAHVHMFTRAMPLAPRAWTRPDYDFTAEQLLATFDEHGVAFGVISAATLFGDYNDYTLAALSRHRRLRATVIVQPDTERATLARMADAGVVGVRLGLRRLEQLPDLRAAPYQRLFHHLADLRMHVELLAHGADLPAILPAIEASGATLVIDHFADPDRHLGTESPGFLAALRSVERGRTFIKLAAAMRLPRDVARACARRLLQVAGPERLLWGSDAPFVGHEHRPPYAEALRLFAELVPDARQRHAIGLTALRQFFF